MNPQCPARKGGVLFFSEEHLVKASPRLQGATHRVSPGDCRGGFPRGILECVGRCRPLTDRYIMAEEFFNEDELTAEIHRQYADARQAMKETVGSDMIIRRAKKSADGIYETFRDLALAHKDDGNEVTPVFALMIAKTLVGHIMEQLLTKPNGVANAVSRAYLDITLPMVQMMYERVQNELMEQEIADMERGDS